MSATMVDASPQEKLFTVKDLEGLDRTNVPRHVAIVMDGNRRWAKSRSMPLMAGHWRGADALIRVVQAACELSIETLTVYAFSTENWKRSSVEVSSLMRLFIAQLEKQKSLMVRDGIRLSIIGDPGRLPEDVQEVLEDAILATQGGTALDLVIALNYGARDEITRAARKMIEDCLANKLTKEEISEKVLARYLDTAQWKDPDLLIRTSGESRVSNFLLWQISYAEIVVTDVLWPDFNQKDLLSVILEYQTRETRGGR